MVTSLKGADKTLKMPTFTLCRSASDAPLAVVSSQWPQGVFRTNHPETANVSSASPPHSEIPTIDLTVLATSDLHGHILSYDYFSDRDAAMPALSRIASAIRRHRDHAENTLLVDNGDFLQGSPLSDLFSDLSPPDTLKHPVISAMNTLGYDAVGLGNHEFNLPLTRLVDVLSEADFPLLCANLEPTAEAPNGVNGIWRPHVILKHRFIDRKGQPHELKIGLFGIVPPQVMNWDHSRVAKKLKACDSVKAARGSVQELREAGADIVIALAHTGLSAAPPTSNMENSGLQIAALEDLDALVLGHTHLWFPGPDQPEHSDIDAANGTVCGVPCVQPGAMGAFLGVLDLTLGLQNDKWSVTAHGARLEQVSTAPEDASLRKQLQPVHDWALSELRRPVGDLPRPIHSYLGLLPGCPSVQIVGDVQRSYVREQLAGTRWSDLPVLSAASPQRCGGRSGPGHFTEIGPGTIAISDISSLQYFPNDVSALRLTGAEIADWLEMSASIYRQIQSEMAQQPLIHPEFPAYNADTVFGLSYEIDLTQAPRFGPEGECLRPDSRRIRNLRWQARALDPEQAFVLAVNNYRAGGGGAFPHVSPDRIILEKDMKIRDLLVRALSDPAQHTLTTKAPWSFTPITGASAVFDTGPGFQAHFDPAARPDLSILGKTDTGFLRVQIHMER